MRRAVLACALACAAVRAWANVYTVTAYSDDETHAMTFTPAHLVIYQYDTVIFVNAGGLHSVHADNNAFICAINCTNNNGPSTENWSVPVQFKYLGDFGYYCEAHGDLNGGMRGEIDVIDRVFVDGFEAAVP
jgi:plastocyanin